MKKEFVVKGMHCASCVMLVNDALEGLDGVRKSDVDLDSGTVRVDFDETLTDKESISTAIRKEGFEVQ